VLNTFLNNDEIRLATLLFHEMAHQVIYVPNDTAFNESFAKTVEMEGLHRWLQASGNDELWQQYLQRESQSAAFIKFIEKIRTELSSVYDSSLEDNHKRLAKQEILTNAYKEYESLKQSLNGFNGYDKWMQRGLNNARLSSLAIYYDLIPAFQLLLQQADYDLQKFYAEVKVLGTLPAQERLARLQSMSPYHQAALN
jgi:predicted aminopeptidase